METYKLEKFYKRKSYIFIKSALYLLVFSLVHFIYDLLPNPLTLFIGANDESVFSHMKMAFWSWIILALLEYIFLRKHIDRRKYFLSRMLTAIKLPFIEILVYYVGVFIAMEELPLAIELTWAFITVYIIGIMGRIIEQYLEDLEYKNLYLYVILILFGLSMFFFTVFTYNKPWLDIFYLP